MKYFASRLSDNLAETPEGFLLCVGVSIARTGDQEYLESETPLKAKDGKIVIHRDEKEVFSPATLASFEGKPFTIGHPTEFVNTQNWKELAHGHIQNVRRGEGDQKNDVVADILITDQKAISLVRSGKRSLSCGYEAEYVQIDDGRGEQRAIVGNHLALVEEGRAGPSYAIKDHKGVSIMKEQFAALLEKVKLLGKTIDAKEEPPAPPKEEKTDDAKMYDELMEMVDALVSKIAALKGGKDAAPVEPEEEKPAADEEVAPGLEARLKKLEEMVAKIMGAEAAESAAMGDKDPIIEAEDSEAPKTISGDEKVRVEILAPGLKVEKDAKLEALTAAYKTADGKAVIDSLGGIPAKEGVEAMFIAASELLKEKRSSALAAARMTAKSKDFQSTIFNHEGHMTPEKMNELNAKRYGPK